MKTFYYSENDESLGPFTIEELKTKRIKKSTLVWTDGLPDWIKAENAEDLNGILVSEPPPLPKREPIISSPNISVSKPTILEQESINKFDLTYTKETEATIAGVVFFIFPLIMQFTGALKFDNQEDYNQAKIWFTILALGLRIGVTIWVVNIAIRQNRNSTGWGLFAFFLPAIALISIGLSRKLRLRIETDVNLPKAQQTSLLYEKANSFYSAKRYFECIEILNKILTIDIKSSQAIYLRGLSYYSLHQYKNAYKDFESLKSNEKFISSANYYLGNIELRNANIDKAVEHWTIAKEKGNKNAVSKLNQNIDYRGKFLLTKEEMKKKLCIDIGTMDGVKVSFLNSKYLKGIDLIDSNQNVLIKQQDIVANEYGVGFIFKSKGKTIYVGLSYTEIDDINFDNETNKISIDLFDGTIIEIYDKYISNNFLNYQIGNESLKYICDRFQEVTSKQSKASLNSI